MIDEITTASLSTFSMSVRELRNFRVGEPEIERDGPRNATQVDENTSAIVYVLEVVEVVHKDGVFIRKDCY
jgi:hypothetical protein